MDWKRMTASLEHRGYTVGMMIGQGAFSRVCRVIEQATGRAVACKASGNIEMIRRESEILSGINHPLFPECYGCWQDGDTAFLMMELVLGENLERLIGRGMNFTVRRTAELGMQLAEGLLYLHERPKAILFRDVKPGNIVLREDGRIKLLDFGCVLVMGEDDRSRAGTPGYAAPEQMAEGGRQSVACDVYGLGRTLQKLYQTGGGSGRSTAERRAGRRLERILAACVEEEPSARPADMRVVMTALAPLSALPGGMGRDDREGEVWRPGIVCEKNIWKSAWKTT